MNKLKKTQNINRFLLHEFLIFDYMVNGEVICTLKMYLNTIILIKLFIINIPIM